MTPARASQLRALRARVAQAEGGRRHGVLPFGDGRVDACFPAGGLPLGRWHELAGEGIEAETAACVAAFTAVLAARLAKTGEVVWVLQRPDLHAPGAAGLGVAPGRLLFVEAGDDAEALAALEDALRARGVAAVVGEVDRLDLVAGRRLQLACEGSGATGFVLRRRVFGRRRGEKEGGPSAATTRWRVAPAPSEPAAGEPGLGAPRWRVRLDRCRGGRAGAWIMEANDEADPVRVVAELADHELAAAPARRAVG
ncbi:MAG TPA: protein imuA [Caulobacteraceae bacterium]|jgi:protein ImuA